MTATMPNTPRFGTNGIKPVQNGKHFDFKMPEFVKEYGLKTISTQPGWELGCYTIPPDLAEKMLACRDEDHQRKVGPLDVRRYQEELETGNFKLTHQGIAFDRMGRLIDGQHRLLACVASDTPLQSLVWFGVADGTAHLVDGCRPRRHIDAASFHGINVSHRFMAVLRGAMNTGCGTRKNTNTEVLQAIETYSESINFACEHGGKLPCQVLAATARAWYYFEPEDLIRFLGVVKLDVPATRNGDKAATMLYKFIASHPNMGGQVIRNEMFAKSVRAIQAYMSGESISRLFATEMDLYPLPADGKPRRDQSLV